MHYACKQSNILSTNKQKQFIDLSRFLFCLITTGRCHQRKNDVMGEAVDIVEQQGAATIPWPSDSRWETIDQLWERVSACRCSDASMSGIRGRRGRWVVEGAAQCLEKNGL